MVMTGNQVKQKVIAKQVVTEASGLEVLDDELFGKPERTNKTKGQKRKEKEMWQRESAISRRSDLPAGKEELEKLQMEDETLEKIRKYAEGEVESPPEVKYVKKDGLLFRIGSRNSWCYQWRAGRRCYV